METTQNPLESVAQSCETVVAQLVYQAMINSPEAAKADAGLDLESFLILATSNIIPAEA
jgi:hypothetical protein